MTTQLDAAWLAAHPLPEHGTNTDKNSRGRVVLAGGARFVPGALRLTGEAVLRAGAGKLQLATVSDIAMHVGVLIPEAAMIALPFDDKGEICTSAIAIVEHAIERCDAFILGPGMSETRQSETLVDALLARPRDGLSVVLDAAAIGVLTDLAGTVRAHGGRVVMTPHHGEMAALTGLDTDYIAANAQGVARDVAAKYDAVVALKASETVIAAPDGTTLHYAGGCVGLATGGSGDVLAGIVGGLIARGTSPLVACAWGVWLHGEAGRACAAAMGPIGFLARELLPEIPRLMASVDAPNS